MQTGLANTVVQLCCFSWLLLSGGVSWALEPGLTPAQTSQQLPEPPPKPGGKILCRFTRSPQAPPLASTCIAEYLSTNHYRFMASCRGLDSCLLSVGAYRPLRVWSPDSTSQLITTSPMLPMIYTFPVFTRSATVTKGPWISGASQQSMVVRWETNSKARSWLRVVNDQFTPPHSARWIEGNSSCPDGASQRCMHTVIISGLSPDRKYSYMLGDVATESSGGMHPGGRLRTELSVGSGSEYSFSVLGDVQGEGGNAWKEVAGYTAELQSSTGRQGGPIIYTGDMTLMQLNDDSFFKLGGATLSNYPFYPALGNNENAALFLRYFGPSGRVSLTDYDRDWKTYYSVNYGKTHFIVLDSNSLPSCISPQAMWLRTDLKSTGATSAENIVVVAHAGPRSYGVYGDNKALRDCLQSLFADSSGNPTDFFRKLRVVFSGHQHDYERIITSHRVGSETRKVHYVTVGTAGARPRCPQSTGAGLVASSAGVCKNPDDVPTDGTYDYQGVVVDVRGRVFELRAYNFSADAAGKLLPKGTPPRIYSLLDCFAMDESGTPIATQNACTP